MATYKPLLADAEAGKYGSEDFVGGNFARNFAEEVNAFANVL